MNEKTARLASEDAGHVKLFSKVPTMVVERNPGIFLTLVFIERERN